MIGPVCEKENCVKCKAIHMNKTCKEYNDEMMVHNENKKKDEQALEVIKLL